MELAEEEIPNSYYWPLGEGQYSGGDASQTMTVGSMAKTMAYYDNVAGYSHQALRLVQLMGSHQPSQ